MAQDIINTTFNVQSGSVANNGGSDYTAFRANLDGNSPEEVVNNTGNLNEYVTSFGRY